MTRKTSAQLRELRARPRRRRRGSRAALWSGRGREFDVPAQGVLAGSAGEGVHHHRLVQPALGGREAALHEGGAVVRRHLGAHLLPEGRRGPHGHLLHRLGPGLAALLVRPRRAARGVGLGDRVGRAVLG